MLDVIESARHAQSNYKAELEQLDGCYGNIVTFPHAVAVRNGTSEPFYARIETSIPSGVVLGEGVHRVDWRVVARNKHGHRGWETSSGSFWVSIGEAAPAVAIRNGGSDVGVELVSIQLPACSHTHVRRKARALINMGTETTRRTVTKYADPIAKAATQRTPRNPIIDHNDLTQATVQEVLRIIRLYTSPKRPLYSIQYKFKLSVSKAVRRELQKHGTKVGYKAGFHAVQSKTGGEVSASTDNILNIVAPSTHVEEPQSGYTYGVDSYSVAMTSPDVYDLIARLYGLDEAKRFLDFWTPTVDLDVFAQQLIDLDAHPGDPDPVWRATLIAASTPKRHVDAA